MRTSNVSAHAPLQEVCTLITDGTHLSPKTGRSGDCLYLTSKNVRPGYLALEDVSFVSARDHETIYRACPVRLGDVLLVKDGANAGSAAVNSLDKPFSLLSSVAVLRPNPTVLDSGYLMHWLNTDEAYARMTARMSGSAIRRIILREICGLRIPVVPLEEQQRVAAILDKTEVIRRKRNSAMNLADEFLRSLFLSMFGDPVTNRNQLRTTNLGSLCARLTDGTHQPPAFIDSGVPFLFVSNVVNGKLIFEKTKFISEETWVALTQRCPIEQGDVLYTTVGSYGNAAMVATNRRFAFQRHIAHIKPALERVRPEFLAFMLNSACVKQQADRLARGAAQKTLNLRELREIVVFDIPLVKQDQFLKIYKKCHNVDALANQSLAEAQSLASSLTSGLFVRQT